MLRILDRRAACDDGLHRQRADDKITGFTIHMFGVPDVHDAAGVAEFYREHPEWTAGQMPYTYVIQPSGIIELALPLWEMGPHALRWSSPTIGIACLGDSNSQTPLRSQWDACVDLTAELTVAHDTQDIRGHTERPWATRISGKNCPGRLFDMNRFRAEVFEARREAAMQRLEAALV